MRYVFVYLRVYLTGSATRDFCLGEVVYVSPDVRARSRSRPGLVGVHRLLNTQVVLHRKAIFRRS